MRIPAITSDTIFKWIGKFTCLAMFVVACNALGSFLGKELAYYSFREQIKAAGLDEETYKKTHPQSSKLSSTKAAPVKEAKPSLQKVASTSGNVDLSMATTVLYLSSNAKFTELDANHDGKLSTKEVAGSDIDFNSADSNHNKSLSFEEVADYLWEQAKRSQSKDTIAQSSTVN